jgi:hypothetical protein
MRHQKTSAEEILKAEKAVDDRRRSRSNGFEKMSERDAGHAKLHNYNGGEVRMLWHIPKDRREDGLVYSGIPDGMFGLELNDQLLVFDAEEFRRQLRWV